MRFPERRGLTVEDAEDAEVQMFDPLRASQVRATAPVHGDTSDSRVSALQNAKTRILDDADLDVFGDGTVVVKATPGHTPGHQVLFVRLAKTGPVVLAGDLYHYRDLPMAQHDPHALPTPAIRDAFATFIERERDAAALLDTWIQEEQGILTQMTRSAGTLRE